MTLLARNEADILDAQIAFHLHAGVDFVIATDNRSDDGTTEILERYRDAGRLHLIREGGDDMRQDEWVTRMARLAATEFDADWVINSDADEFWWPRGGSLRDVLATIPDRYGAVRGCWRHFVPRSEDDRFFAERMTARLTTPAHPGDKRTVFHVHQKVAHRGHPEVVVDNGNHDVEAPHGLEPLRGWHPVEVLHFSIRSPAQLARKGRGGWLRNRFIDPPEHVRRVVGSADGDSAIDLYRELAVDDVALTRGLGDGTLEIDTRVRDALRALRADDGSFILSPAGREVCFQRPSVEADATFAGETSLLVGIDGIVRAEERTEALEGRLNALSARAARGLGGAVGRRPRTARR